MTTVRVIPVPFRVLAGKKYDRNKPPVLELVPLRGKNEFEPHLQNEILVPFRSGVIFKISDDHPHHFYMGVPPRDSNHGSPLHFTFPARTPREILTGTPFEKFGLPTPPSFILILVTRPWFHCLCCLEGDLYKTENHTMSFVRLCTLNSDLKNGGALQLRSS